MNNARVSEKAAFCNGRLSCKSLYPAASFVRGMGRIKPTERARKRILSDSEPQSVWKTAEER